jgi:hypothetical protein
LSHRFNSTDRIFTYIDVRGSFLGSVSALQRSMRTSEHQNIRTLVVVAVVVYPREAVAGVSARRRTDNLPANRQGRGHSMAAAMIVHVNLPSFGLPFLGGSFKYLPRIYLARKSDTKSR